MAQPILSDLARRITFSKLEQNKPTGLFIYSETMELSNIFLKLSLERKSRSTPMLGFALYRQQGCKSLNFVGWVEGRNPT